MKTIFALICGLLLAAGDARKSAADYADLKAVVSAIPAEDLPKSSDDQWTDAQFKSANDWLKTNAKGKTLTIVGTVDNPKKHHTPKKDWTTVACTADDFAINGINFVFTDPSVDLSVPAENVGSETFKRYSKLTATGTIEKITIAKPHNINGKHLAAQISVKLSDCTLGGK